MSDDDIADAIAAFLWRDDQDGFMAWMESLSESDRAAVRDFIRRVTTPPPAA